MDKVVLTSGCSFTSQLHPNDGGPWNRPKFNIECPTWSDYLYEDGHDVINIAFPTNANTSITRGLICKGHELVKQGKKVSIIAQFTMAVRSEIFISSKESSDFDYYLPKKFGGKHEFSWNLNNWKESDFRDHFWILTGGNLGDDPFDNEYIVHKIKRWAKYFYNRESQVLNTIERIFDLQTFCKKYDIPLKIFFLDGKDWDVENFYHYDFQQTRLYENLIDWNSIWFHDLKKDILLEPYGMWGERSITKTKYGGMEEWMHDVIDSDIMRYKDIDDSHPSDFAHRKFVDEVIYKWDVL